MNYGDTLHQLMRLFITLCNVVCSGDVEIVHHNTVLCWSQSQLKQLCGFNICSLAARNYGLNGRALCPATRWIAKGMLPETSTIMQ